MKRKKKPQTTALTKRQTQVMPYLVASGNVTEAARLAEISRATLYRWMEDDEFRGEFDRLRNEAAELAFSELRGLMLKATQVIAEGMEDDNPSTRLRSARAAMDVGLKANELKRIEDRIDRIDQAIHMKDEG